MKTREVIIIAAMSNNRLIGSGEGLPWSVEEEYRQYLSFVAGHTVIMGRRSYQIFGKELTSRHNLVISRSLNKTNEASIFKDFEKALDYAMELPGKVFIAGGASIYKLALPVADAMYLSFIKGEFEGDRYFPQFDPEQWKVHKRILHPRFDFVEYHTE